MLSTIAFVIFFISLAAMAAIVVRKFSELAVLKVEAMPNEQTEQIKKSLLEKRLERIFAEWMKRMRLKLSPLFKFLDNLFSSWHARLLELYERHKKIKPKTAVERLERIRHLMAHGDELIKNENYSEAERVFIEAISLDHKNVEAYCRLAEVYNYLKEYNQARETYEFILKLIGDDAGVRTKLGIIAKTVGDFNRAEHEYLASITLSPKVASTYAELGHIYQAMGETEKAFANFLNAVELEPNNPRYLDSLLEMSIIIGNLAMAEEIFEKLRSVNPDNKKLADFRKKIRAAQMKLLANSNLQRKK